MASFTNLATLDWDNRDPQLFFDEILSSNDILSRFTVYDGVKKKKSIPIFETTLLFDDSKCTYAPESTADIDEKEFTVGFKRWSFHNCKDKLETSYRSVLLKKGQLNEETLDSQFAGWVYGHFVEQNAAKLLDMSWNGYIPDGSHSAPIIAAGTIPGIKSEVAADIAGSSTTVHSETWSTAISKSNILARMEAVYLAMGTTNLEAVHGDSNVEYKPVFLLGTMAYTYYQLAVAAAVTTEYSGIEKGLIKTYLDMEVLHYGALEADSIVATPLSNLVIVTDDYNDADAIQTEYDKKTNSDDIWGQYMLGFSYKQGDRITYGYKV